MSFVHTRAEPAVCDRGRNVARLRPGGIVISFDMRPPPWALRAMRSLSARRRGGGAADASVTPTTRISAGELERLFDRGTLEYASAGLAFGLCSVANRSYLAARMLAAVPGLREHGIGVVRGPDSEERRRSHDGALTANVRLTTSLRQSWQSLAGPRSLRPPAVPR